MDRVAGRLFLGLKVDVETGTAHWCDDGCVCPLHQTPLYWSPSRELHACQDPECHYASGFEPALAEDMPPCVPARPSSWPC